MKELIDQFDLIALPLSIILSYLTSPIHRPFVMDRTDKCVCVDVMMIDLGILFYFISIIIVKSRRLERAQGPF